MNHKKRIKIKQHDITDCGAACLASVCAHYGLFFPVSRIRQYAFTDRKGTNVQGMIEAAGKLGFAAKGVKACYEALHTIVPQPSIAHMVLKDGLHHFVVVYKATEKQITCMDPVDGRIHKKSNEDFEREWSGVLVILEPGVTFRKGNMKKSNFSRFLSLLMPNKSMMLQALFGALVFSVLGLSTSVYAGKITDYVLVDKNVNLLNLMGVIMIIILLLRTFIGSMKSILALKTGQRIDAALILGYYKHLLTLPQQFFDTMRVGEIISRVNDAVKIRDFINNVSLDLVVNTMILFFSFCLMFVYSWELTLVTLFSIPLFIIIYWFFNRLNRKYQRGIMESAADLESQLVESIHAISTIKRFGVEEYASLKTESRFVHLLRNIYHSIYGYIMAEGGIQFVSTGMTIAVLWVGSTLVIDQELTPGALIVFYSLIGYVLGPVGSLVTTNQNVQDALIASDRLFQIMDLEREEDDSQKLELEPDMIGDITFEEVNFRYGAHKEVFHSLNVRIAKGKITAVVGGSGSGKTTLVSILQHIYPVESGRVKIGNYDVARITNESLRKRIGTVPQQIELFAGSVVDNIALGDLQPDMKRIMALVEQLGLTGFIEKLPKGYMTYIGEYGASLSGGERQRIAIARALYREPEILIFDEATSSLDSIAERYVKQTLTDLVRQGKTVVVIAHRLSTIKNADVIVVLSDGQVVETGTHDVLCKADGVYSRFWKEQQEYIE
ncbi:MAG: peptidase domain-containing ABC transporter [Mediterranea sp.]|jgi:ATP-binding cassette subfamily B protein|nr:peptidase domain-containing ABC transporter [Mediterranea sp.]